MRRPDDPHRLFEDPDAPAPQAEAMGAARGRAPAPPAPAAPLAPGVAAPTTAGMGTVKLFIIGLGAGAVVAVTAVGVRGGGPFARKDVPARAVVQVHPIEKRAPKPPAVDIPAEGPPSPAPPSRAEAASRLRDEAALVQKAERRLASDPASALRLTDERRRRFPGGALDQEAEVVAIDALLRLGRRPDAAARARAFDQAHAGSLHARRIRRLMGN